MSDDTEKIRLNKFLAIQLGISRRQADDLIGQGKVTINTKKASLGARITSSDEIAVSGSKLAQNQREFQYLLLNKPTGYVCSRRKQGNSETIYALLPQNLHQLKPVGRLDKDSSGLLLLTNDGDFTFKMTHPSFQKTKEYEVRLDQSLQPLHQQMIADFGIGLSDGTSQLGLERLDESRTHWRVIMSEGRNRQIRRTFSALGYEVIELHRYIFGPYNLPPNLKPGEYIFIDKK